MTKHRTSSRPVLKIAVVGGGERCLRMMKMLESDRLENIRATIVGVADINPEAAGFKYAQEKGVFTTDDYHRLLEIEDLDLIIELTGNEQLLHNLASAKPETVRVLDYTASRLFHDVVRFGQELERRETETLTARSIAKAVIAAVSEDVLVLDRDYRIVDINDVALARSGLSREEALTRYCFQISHRAIAPCDPPDAPCPFRQTLETGKSAHAIHEHIAADGSSRFYDVSTYPLYDAQGQIFQVLEINRDITDEVDAHLERRTAELKDDLARAVQEDKLISLGKMVASVAHEINNPISAIINFTKLILTSIREGKVGPDELQEFDRYLDLSLAEAERSAKIVGNLLSFARQTDHETKAFDLREVVDKIVALTKHKMELDNLELALELGDGALNVRGDYTQIQQVLINLVFNAMEAMPQGGRLTISGGREADTGRVWLEVADTGQGIEPEILPRIFEPFFTTKGKGKGVGLGLAMVYGIVRDHGGDILVDSHPGQGARFRVVLPGSEDDAPP